MKTIEVEEIYLWAILTFLESAEDIGYIPEQHGSVRDWFTNKNIDEMTDIISNLLSIIENENE